MTNMNATDLISNVDRAAAMNDRWLFVASLVVFGVFAWFVMRYFVLQHERLIEDHKQARDSYQESLRGVVAEQSAANAKLIVCLDNNTKVLEECRDELRLVRMERKQVMKKMSRGEKIVWAAAVAGALALLVACASGCSDAGPGGVQAGGDVDQRAGGACVHEYGRADQHGAGGDGADQHCVCDQRDARARWRATWRASRWRRTWSSAVVTNFVPVFYTNVVQVPVTNLVAKPEAEAAIQAAGSVVNTFAPGIGSILALALAGLYHGYRQVRNRKVNEALIQGVETARAVLTTTPQGQAADAQFVKWLMEHQKEAGVFTTVSGLVEQLTRQSGGQDDGAGDCAAGAAGAAAAWRQPGGCGGELRREGAESKLGDSCYD